MRDELGRTIIRPSALASYGDTPRRTAATLFKDEFQAAGYTVNDTPGGIAATVGTALHRGAELLLTDKMKGQYGPGSLSSATDAAIENLRSNAQRGIVMDATSPTVSTAEKQVARMTDCYAQHAVPDIEPIALEQRLVIDMGDDFVLSGQSDVVALAPEGCLEDTKSGVISRTHAAQLGGYTMAQRAHGRDIKFARTRFIQRVSIKKDQPPPAVQRYELWAIEPITAIRIRNIKRDLMEFRRLVEVGNADPISAIDCNPMSMLCSRKFCGLWGTDGCFEWQFKEKSDDDA